MMQEYFPTRWTRLRNTKTLRDRTVVGYEGDSHPDSNRNTWNNGKEAGKETRGIGIDTQASENRGLKLCQDPDSKLSILKKPC